MNEPKQSTALIVGSPVLLASVVVLSQEVTELVDGALSKAATILTVPTDNPEIFQAQKEVCDDLGGLKTTIDEARLAATKPHRDFTDAINDAANAVLAKVKTAHQRLGGMLKAAEVTMENNRQAIIRENARLAQKELDDAEAARKAAQKKIDDAHAAECLRLTNLHEAQKAAALAAQPATAEGDDAPPADPIEVPALVLPVAPPVFVAPEPARTVHVPTLFVPDKVSSGVRTTAPKYEVQVVNAALVPREFGGIELMTLDTKAATTLCALLFKQKKQMPPGLAYVQVAGPGIASTGRG